MKTCRMYLVIKTILIIWDIPFYRICTLLLLPSHKTVKTCTQAANGILHNDKSEVPRIARLMNHCRYEAHTFAYTKLYQTRKQALVTVCKHVVSRDLFLQ